MNSLKIVNNGGDYTVSVSAGNVTKDVSIDTHAQLVAFVNRLKRDGYIVVNDNY